MTTPLQADAAPTAFADLAALGWVALGAGLAVAVSGWLRRRPAAPGDATPWPIEDALRRSEERLEAAMEAAQATVWEWNLHTGAFVSTDRFKRHLGYDLAEIADTAAAWYELVHPDDREVLTQAQVAHLRGQRDNFDVEHRLRMRSGEWLWVMSHGRVVERDQSGRSIRLVGMTRDRSDRKRLEEQWLQAQKMEAVGQLAGGVAHDFNNAMQVILGMADLLALRPQTTVGERERELQQIRDAAERAGRLTQQLLAFSRRQVLQPRPVDVTASIRDLGRLLRRLLGDRITLQVTLAPDLGFVRVDPAHFDQAMLNLAVNARDAMPDRGTLAIETTLSRITPEMVGGRADVQAGPAVCVAVQDSGVGMSEEVRRRIFEPFFTTKTSGQGTGLGLAMVYGFIRQSGGHIEVDSAPGTGTTFRIYLPIVSPPPKPPRAAGLEDLHGGSETVLVVEDEAPVRALCQALLEQIGYRVLVASSGEEALAVAAKHSGPIDLLLTDIMMPGMGGRELAQTLVARRAMPVLLMSGHAPLQVGSGPSYQILTKPFTLETMASAVRRVLDGAAE